MACGTKIWQEERNQANRISAISRALETFVLTSHPWYSPTPHIISLAVSVNQKGTALCQEKHFSCIPSIEIPSTWKTQKWNIWQMWGKSNLPFVPISLRHSLWHQSLKSMASARWKTHGRKRSTDNRHSERIPKPTQAYPNDWSWHLFSL